jgi:hypothetical protein
MCKLAVGSPRSLTGMFFVGYQYWFSLLRATTHTRLRARYHYTSSTLIGGKGRAGPSSLHTMLEGPTGTNRDQRSMWMQDGCKAHMNSNTASNGSCLLITRTVFKNHLLKAGLIPNRETMALRTLTTIGLFYFTMSEDPTCIEIHWNSIWLRV